MRGRRLAFIHSIQIIQDLTNAIHNFYRINLFITSIHLEKYDCAQKPYVCMTTINRLNQLSTHFTYINYLCDLTCPSFLEVFGIVILCNGFIETLGLSKPEAPLTLGPAGEILLIAEEQAIQKAHYIAGVLPHFTTQSLESQGVNMSNIKLQK